MNSLKDSHVVSTCNRKRKSAEEVNAVIPPKRPCFSPPTHRQNWSLPESIIYYIAKNPSTPELYQKLIRTCKYFFAKNPIIVCNNIGMDDPKEMNMSHNYVYKTIDLNDFRHKLWIVTSISVYALPINIMATSALIPKIYRCEATCLILCKQILSWKEYLGLISRAKLIFMDEVIVTDEDGSIVPIEKIFEFSVKADYVRLHGKTVTQSITCKTVKNLLHISHFAALKNFHLNEIPEVFDVDAMFAYLKKNRQADFNLTFSDQISEAYRTRLNAIIDEIVDGEKHCYKVPMIKYAGQDPEKLDKLRKLNEKSVGQ